MSLQRSCVQEFWYACKTVAGTSDEERKSSASKMSASEFVNDLTTFHRLFALIWKVDFQRKIYSEGA